MCCAVPQCHLMAPPGFVYRRLSRFTLDSPPVSYKPLTAHLQPAGTGHGCHPQGLGSQLASDRSRPCRVLTGARGALQGSVCSLRNVFAGSVGAGLSQRGWKRGSGRWLLKVKWELCLLKQAQTDVTPTIKSMKLDTHLGVFAELSTLPYRNRAWFGNPCVCE